MVNNEEFEKELKEIIENYKKDHQPISIAVADIAHRYNMSVHAVYNYIDLYLREDDDSHMDFRGNKTLDSEYVKRRWEGQ